MKTFSGIMLTALLIGTLTLTLNTQQVDSSQPPSTEWTQTYGGADYDWALSVVQTSDGGYALAGETESFSAAKDFWLVKTDAVGNMEWNRTYGGQRDQYARSVVETADGGYALCGTTESIGPGGVDFWLVKTDQYGNAEWDQRYGGTAEDWGWSVIQTVDTGYAMVGVTRSFGDVNGDFWLVKTNSTGHMMWSQTYGGTSSDGARSVVQTSDGGYVIAGSTNQSRVSSDFWLVKTNSTGNMVWNKTYGGVHRDWCRSVVETVDGGYALAGSTFSFGAGSWDSWLVKTDSAGNMVWNKTYGRTGSDGTEFIVQTSDEGYALAGHTSSYGAEGGDFWLVKTDSAGTVQWNQTYGGVSQDIAYSVVQTGDSGYALAGYTESFGAGLWDFWVVKVAPDIHDLAVINVVPSKTIVGQGYYMPINVTVENQGGFTETFNVTLYAQSVVQNQTVTLESATSTIVTFMWNTTGIAYGNYTISAEAIPVQSETETADNTFTDGWVIVTTAGDVNGDKVVDIFDLSIVGQAYGCFHWMPCYNPCADITEDGLVDARDLAVVTLHYGESNS